MKKITKLSIFDFDGTLVNTPLPDTGKILYQQKTGKPWPHEGWWGKRESLDMEIFEMKAIASVRESYHEEKSKDETLMVMLTGRMKTHKVDLTAEVKAILDSHKFEFDEYILNKGGSTDMSKKKSIEKLLEKYCDVDFIEMWDDRDEHIPIFEAFGAKLITDGRLKHFKLNHVLSGHHDPINNDVEDPLL